MTRKKTLLSMAAVTGILVALVGAPSAQADPASPNDTALVAVGSDTSQDVMNGLAAVAKDASNNPLFVNYNATPVGGTIRTRTAANDPDCNFTRPRNSGDGVNALSAAINGLSFFGTGATGTPVTSPNMTGCVNVGRTSSGGNPSSAYPSAPGTITYIPFATDSISFATLTVSDFLHKMNINEIRRIYQLSGTPGSDQCEGYAPLLPAAGSGTRSYFVGTMLGLSDTAPLPVASPTATTLGSCVRDTNAAGNSIQEHDGRFLTAANQIIPFSVSQFIAQQTQAITDNRGRATLGAIDFTGAAGTATTTNVSAPVSLSTSFGTGTRPIYNAVASSALGDAKVSEAFVGPTSDVCQAQATIRAYGMATRSDCGDTSKKNT